ncbi:MAG: class I SAM-dependent methyltransferase [Chloroflexi bacterium]|nr:class I SAM-dependent methyltransferase [Chloroflexota bacterium]
MLSLCSANPTVFNAVGHVTGLDLSPDSLIYARDIVNKAGLSERIAFQKGNVNKLPFDDNTFDWAWSVGCVGYASIEPVGAVKELARVGKPVSSAALIPRDTEERQRPVHYDSR